MKTFVADVIEKSSFFLKEQISLNLFLPENILGHTSQKKPFQKGDDYSSTLSIWHLDLLPQRGSDLIFCKVLAYGHVSSCSCSYKPNTKLQWLSFLQKWTLAQDFYFFIDIDVGVAIGIIENGKAMPLAVIFNLWHLFLYFLRTSLTKIVTLGSQQIEVLQCFNGKVVTWKLNSSAVQITCWSVHLYLLLSAG